MANAEYVIGTKEYIRLELTAEAPGFTFVADEWEVEVALWPFSESFDGKTDVATWHDATLTSLSGADYVLVLAGDGAALDPATGKYKVLVKPTKKVGGVEDPIFEAVGWVSYGPA